MTLQSKNRAGRRKSSKNGAGFFSALQLRFRSKSAAARDWTADLVETVRSFDFSTKVICGFLAAAFAIFASYTLISAQISLNEKQRELDSLRVQIEEQKAIKENLVKILNSPPDEYIRTRARDDLGMGEPGERVFINTPGE